MNAAFSLLVLSLLDLENLMMSSSNKKAVTPESMVSRRADEDIGRVLKIHSY